MDGFEAGSTAELSPAITRGVAARGIFLHSGWRSCGTWLWERLRERSQVLAFYEPLHEDLGRLRAEQIGAFRPDSWTSGHGLGAPYFAEYAGHLGASGVGVQGYCQEFAFDNFFAPASSGLPALHAYISGLVGAAREQGSLPVLKFCRSLGRVPWFEAHFPDMLHAVVVRDPIAQWRSARLQMERNRNRYFVLAPFIILARNPGDEVLSAAMAALGVKRPPVISRNLDSETIACWRHVGRIGWTERFRGFLALWCASTLAALDGAAMLIDSEALGCSPDYLAGVEEALAAVAGPGVHLAPDEAAGGAWIGSAEEWADARTACRTALEFVVRHDGHLAAARAALMRRKLERHAEEGGIDAAPGGPARPAEPRRVELVDAAIYVALSRASYPLRRAHYHVRRALHQI